MARTVELDGFPDELVALNAGHLFSLIPLIPTISDFDFLCIWMIYKWISPCATFS